MKNFARAGLETILADAAGTLPAPGFGALIPSLCWVKERDDDPLSLTISSTAVAAGMDTLVTEDADCQLTAFDWGSLATGTVTLAAYASGPEDGLASASAESLVDVADADIVFLFTTTLSGSGTEEGTGWSAQQTTTSYWALDIDGMKPRGGPIVIEIDQDLAFCGMPALLEGNAAIFDVANEATGDNSFVNVLLEALTVEDAMSSITSVIEAAAANDPPPPPPPPVCPPRPACDWTGPIARVGERLFGGRDDGDWQPRGRPMQERGPSEERGRWDDRDARHANDGRDNDGPWGGGHMADDMPAGRWDGDGWHGARPLGFDGHADIA